MNGKYASYRVELLNISKSFGGISALKNVTLKIRPGEIHALIGENGAGKSTLMKILTGACSKDSGKILIDGSEVDIRNTHDSRKYGIGIIYQEFSLVPALSVAENIFLNQLPAQGKWIRRESMKRRAESLIRNLGFNINPSTQVGKLSIAHQQIVEISKALSEKVRILILDEPSAVIGPNEIKRLFDTLNQLKEEGVAIVYISHRLSEVFQIADRITVLKDGISSDPLIASETDEDAIIKLMLGRSLQTMYPARKTVLGEELLRVETVSPGDKNEEVSFAVKAGEILGIGGLVGSGRTEIARAIFAADRKKKGKVFLSGMHLHLRSPSDAVKSGIGMIPEDRKQHGIILSISVKQNISLTDLDSISNPFGFIKEKEEQRNTKELIRKLSIKAQNENARVFTLSGGNQQKVVLAKWINRTCKVILIDEPTRGVDVGAKVEIYKLINDLSRQGIAIVVISSDSSELMGICDRILIVRKGKVVGNMNREEYSEEEVLRMSIGKLYKKQNVKII